MFDFNQFSQIIEIINFDQIIQFLLAPNFKGFLLLLKRIFSFVSLILFVAILILIWKIQWLKWRFLIDLSEFLRFRPFGLKKIDKEWMKIKARLDTLRESEYKLAIIEADLMLDEVLKKMGYSGQTLGERLKILSKDVLSNLNEVWEAHRIRNNIVHDPDFKLSLEVAKKAISIYEKALIDLDVL